MCRTVCGKLTTIPCSFDQECITLLFRYIENLRGGQNSRMCTFLKGPFVWRFHCSWFVVYASGDLLSCVLFFRACDMSCDFISVRPSHTGNNRVNQTLKATCRGGKSVKYPHLYKFTLCTLTTAIIYTRRRVLMYS